MVLEKQSGSPRLGVIVVGIITVTITFFVLLPSIIICLLPGPQSFFPQRVYEFNSPDNRYQVIVSRRVNFPASEIVDPSITVNLSLKRANDPREIDTVQLKMYEFGDLKEPELTWTPTEVSIDKIDQRDEFAFRFRLPTDSD